MNSMYDWQDSISAMMEFTEILKNEPIKAKDYIECNIYRFQKEELKNILVEVLQSLNHHVGHEYYGNAYGHLYEDILGDVQIELDEQYEEKYEKYSNWLHEAIH